MIKKNYAILQILYQGVGTSSQELHLLEIEKQMMILYGQIIPFLKIQQENRY